MCPNGHIPKGHALGKQIIIKRTKESQSMLLALLNGEHRNRRHSTSKGHRREASLCWMLRPWTSARKHPNKHLPAHAIFLPPFPKVWIQ